MGSIVIKLPLPPACLPTLWQADARMRESYLDEFPGYYKTADAGFKDEDGYIFVMGRTDDIINVAGHRLSTGGMEEVLASHPDVAECAVLGIKDELKGEVPCGFIVLKSGVNRPPTEIEKECIALVREKIGPVAAFKLAITVARLPKTRSGKILRGTIKKIADGDALADAGDDRRSGGAGRDRECVEGEGRGALTLVMSVSGAGSGTLADFVRYRACRVLSDGWSCLACRCALHLQARSRQRLRLLIKTSPPRADPASTADTGWPTHRSQYSPHLRRHLPRHRTGRGGEPVCRSSFSPA